jgi:hypothetical protein
MRCLVVDAMHHRRKRPPVTSVICPIFLPRAAIAAGARRKRAGPGAQTEATLRMLLLSDRWAEVSAHCQAAGTSLTTSGHTHQTAGP